MSRARSWPRHSRVAPDIPVITEPGVRNRRAAWWSERPARIAVSRASTGFFMNDGSTTSNVDSRKKATEEFGVEVHSPRKLPVKVVNLH